MPAPPPPPAGTDHQAGVVDAVEKIVDRAVYAAELSLARRIGVGGLRAVLWTLRAAGWASLAAYFAFGTLVLAARYWWMPRIDASRALVEQLASQTVHARVTIGHIQAGWQGINPRLTLDDVRLQDSGGATALSLPQVEAVASWTSVLTLRPRLDSLTILAPEFEAQRLPGNRYMIAGIVVDPQAAQADNALADWVLQQHRIAIRDARVHFVDRSVDRSVDPSVDGSVVREPPSAAGAQADADQAVPTAFDFTDVNFVLTRGLGGHHFAVQARPPSQLAGLIDLRGEFRRPWSEPATRVAGWSGQLYAQLDFADLKRIDTLAHIVPEPMRLQHANGALRAWIDFSALHVDRLRADLALTEVEARLRPDLEPLRLASVQGRVTERAWTSESESGYEVTLNRFSFEGPEGLKLPATDILYRNTRPPPGAAGGAPEHTQFEASLLWLGDLSRLAAQVPLPPSWQSTIARYAARGQVHDLRAAWDGDPARPSGYTLHAGFSGLGCAADPLAAEGGDAAAPSGGPPGNESTQAGRPGFENLSGVVDLTATGGSLQLDSTGARLVLPGVFEEPQFDLARLTARLRWSRANGALRVDVDSLAAANDDAEINATGNYRRGGKGAGLVDISGRLLRGKAAGAYRYIPASAASARRWVRGAVVDGSITGGSFKLRGDLADFPFVDPARGDFHAELNVAGGRLDIGAGSGERRARPVWPLLEGIDAGVVFDHARMDIDTQRASAYGVKLTRVGVHIAHLDQRDQHLAVEGQGNGPLADMLRYVNTSPVGPALAGLLASADATGNAALQLTLDIPLVHSIDTTVGGVLGLQANDLNLRPDIAPFSALSGTLEFTQRSLKLRGVVGGFVGGQVRIDGDTRADGTIVMNASGTATPQGAKRMIDAAVVRRLLDHARGTTRYNASIALRRGTTALHIDSDLVGLAIGLPQPLRKASAETLPLQIDLQPVAGPGPEHDHLAASLGTVLSLQLERRLSNADDGASVERGALGIGTEAVLPDSGMLVNLDLQQLDLDRWRQVLAGTFAEGAPGAAGGGTRLDYIAARIGELNFGGKSFEHLVLGASLAADDSWTANIDSDQASGSVHWVGAQHGAAARLTARLARLTIQDRQKQDVAQLLDAPPTDVPALDVIADDFTLGSAKLGRLEVTALSSGAEGAWMLQKLEIANPDGKVTGNGVWQREPRSTSRRMNLKLSLTMVNAGNLLARFGLTGVLRNGSGKLDGELSWRGSPFAIDYPSLDGKLRLETEKGQFLKTEPGVARLLGVISLQSLPHRLAFDFRDVFSQGFAFDSIRATADSAGGVITTHDFQMRGVSATALIEGSIDLRTETQNLHVLVLPVVDASSASVVYALLANPAIGLGTLLAQLVLRNPLSKAFSYDVDVTGTWADPQVKRRERSHPQPIAGERP